MHTSLDHLPAYKQKELARLVEIVHESIAAAHEHARSLFTSGKPDPAWDNLKGVDLIILFGSHARGDWVEDEYIENGTVYSYRSDFDILIACETCRLARKLSVWNNVEQAMGRLRRTDVMDEDEFAAYEAAGGAGGEAGSSGGLHPIYSRMGTPARVIAHTAKFVNAKLNEGQYFFSDIHNEGIVLFDSGRAKLNEPRKLEGAERKEQAEKDYAFWSQSANEFLEIYEVAIEREWLNKAAFFLHQAAEHFYGAVELTFTAYKPKTHDLAKLQQSAGNRDPQLFNIFPTATEEERRLFDLLRDAYVRARYDEAYTITSEELDYLAKRVEALKLLTEHVCQGRIASYT